MLTIAFVCVHNSCRSQMAEAYANALNPNPALFKAYSAGTEDYPEVKPKAVAVMEEIGISMAGYKPKKLDALPKDLDIVVTMGCHVHCPMLPSKHREDWGLIDPSGGNLEDFRATRKEIKEKMLDLIDRIEKQNL